MGQIIYPDIRIGDKKLTEFNFRDRVIEDGDEDGDISETKPASKELIDMIGLDPMTIEEY